MMKFVILLALISVAVAGPVRYGDGGYGVGYGHGRGGYGGYGYRAGLTAV